MNNILPRFCGECRYLHPKEKLQKPGEPHICGKYKRVLLHAGWHPNIPVLTECTYHDQENRYRHVGKIVIPEKNGYPNLFPKPKRTIDWGAVLVWLGICVISIMWVIFLRLILVP